MTRDLQEACSFYVIMPFNIRGHSIGVYISDFRVGPHLSNRYVQNEGGGEDRKLHPIQPFIYYFKCLQITHLFPDLFFSLYIWI